MKNTQLSRILFILIMLFFPLSSQAHGGFEKQVGNTTVYIVQDPISPLVGEVVKATLVLKQGANQPLADLNVTVRVIDTFYGDATKDQEILVENKKTDANGAFDFSYTFDKENYFDVEIQFNDPKTGMMQETGFLIQPRSKSVLYKNNWAAIIFCGISGVFIGLGINKLKR